MKRNVEQWGLWLLVCALLAGTLALFPTPAQAATTGWWPGHFFGHGFGHGGQVLPGFWVTGEVTAVEDESVTVQLPNHHHTRGMMRHVRLQVTLAVDSNTILLDEELEPLTLTTLQAGDEVIVSPRLVWGNLVARLLYAGDPEDLADASYRGSLVEMDGDTLTLKNGRKEFTVQVDADTIWYDDAQMERPTVLPDAITLRVLGIAEEDNEEGDDIIRAILITPGRGY